MVHIYSIFFLLLFVTGQSKQYAKINTSGVIPSFTMYI